MRVLIDGSVVRLVEPSDFRSLAVLTSAPRHEHEDLNGWGTVAGDHAWLNIDRLRSEINTMLFPASVEDEFAAMIAYAKSQSWVSEDGFRVRAHLTRGDLDGFAAPE